MERVWSCCESKRRVVPEFTIKIPIQTKAILSSPYLTTYCYYLLLLLLLLLSLSLPRLPPPPTGKTTRYNSDQHRRFTDVPSSYLSGTHLTRKHLSLSDVHLRIKQVHTASHTPRFLIPHQAQVFGVPIARGVCVTCSRFFQPTSRTCQCSVEFERRCLIRQYPNLSQRTASFQRSKGVAYGTAISLVSRVMDKSTAQLQYAIMSLAI